MLVSSFAGVLAGAVLLSIPAGAQPAKMKAGTLTCEGGAGVGLVLGSQKTYTCTYKSVSGHHVENYTASVSRIGLDIGVTSESIIIWTVLASTDSLEPRALAGTYAGASADVALGIGGGANVLVGGSKESIVLQPISVAGQTGLNLALGVAEMTIR